MWKRQTKELMEMGQLVRVEIIVSVNRGCALLGFQRFNLKLYW